jgi:GNAT superfamily N-acetyltransferase
VGATVRIAGEADGVLLASLRREWAEEDAGRPIVDDSFEASFASWLESEGRSRTFFVVEVDGHPVGMANLKEYARMPSPGRDPDAWGYVGNAFVRPEHRSAGVGAALMQALTASAWQRGYDKLRLSPTPRAVPFYERLGFVPSALRQLDR